ncbi:MAG: outer membrane beta-barrel protein [Hyphomicrobiaceae bacterium]
MLKKAGVLGLVTASLMWTGAALADQCHSGPFNGFYLGASVGYAGLDADQHPLGDPSLSSDDGSVIIGGHVGYNIQCGRVVVGVEGDLSYLDLETRATQPDQTQFITKVDALGTLRGRLGIAVHDTTLVYATAGVAWADRTHHLIAPNSPGGYFEQSDSDWATGFVVGGGVEFLRHERWSVRAEVLWADLGDKDRTYFVTGCGGVPCEAHARWDDQVWTARLGVSLKLGGHEPRYEPLK